MRHTPAPWRIHGNTVMQDKGAEFNNWYSPTTHGIAVVSNEADRLLIATAPELLHACELLISYSRLADNSQCEADEEAALEMLDRAVSAALTAVSIAKNKEPEW